VILINKGYLYLKMLRKMLKITQKELACVCECCQSTYCKMENGDIEFPLPLGKKVADYINSKLVPNGYETLVMDAIFFDEKVTYMKQKEE
jgi:DNA-binding XRE family transcriptional regulator